MLRATEMQGQGVSLALRYATCANIRTRSSIAAMSAAASCLLRQELKTHSAHLVIGNYDDTEDKELIPQ
jgi:hypothetical protein